MKEVVGAVVANFPGELRRLATELNLCLLESNCKLIRMSAQFFFGFKRICSILSCANEAVAIGANVANFLGELGRLASWSNS